MICNPEMTEAKIGPDVFLADGINIPLPKTDP